MDGAEAALKRTVTKLEIRYIVPYRVRGETVEVLRVVHTSPRLPQKWLLR